MGAIVHFSLGFILLDSVLVERIGSGVVLGRIDTQGGRRQGWLVQTDAGPWVVYREDVRAVAA